MFGVDLLESPSNPVLLITIDKVGHTVSVVPHDQSILFEDGSHDAPE